MSKTQWDTPLILALAVWICSLPIVALLVVPFFGWETGLIVAAILLFIILAFCWSLCMGGLWQAKKLKDE